MRNSIAIAYRFLTHRRRAMMMSLAGTVFGIAFFILTQAQTGGFEHFFIKTILGVNGAIRVESPINTPPPAPDGMVFEDRRHNSAFLGQAARSTGEIEHPRELRQALLQFSAVKSVSEILREKVAITGGLHTQPALIHGIRILDHLETSNLGTQVIQGNVNDFRDNPAAVLMGSGLAQRLGISLGDTILGSFLGQTRRWQIAGIFETGIGDIDRQHVYIHLDEARLLLQRPVTSSYLQVSLHRPAEAEAVSRQIELSLNHHASSWQKREKTWLEVFHVLRISSAITVSSIILISGLGIFNTLAMMAMEKKQEIAIMRAMGYTRRDIARIFLWQGAMMVTVGTILGWMLAFFLTLGVSNLPIHIRGIFSTDHFVVYWSVWHYISAAVLAFIIVMTASYFPAQRAAGLEPGAVIRGSS